MFSAAPLEVDLGLPEGAEGPAHVGQVQPGGPSRVIVRFHSQPGAAEMAEIASQNSLSNPRKLMPTMWLFDAADASAIDSVLATLQNDRRIDFAELDQRISPRSVPNDDLFSRQWAHQNRGQGNASRDADIDTTNAWSMTTGKGRTIVAVIDTGIDWKHPDLRGNIWRNAGESGDLANDGIDNDGNGYVDDVRGWDFANWDNNPMDDNGHGTHVAGIIGAEGDNGRGVAGVNWNVQLMPLKFLDARGSGWTSDAISALEYAMQNGAQISNNSWGGSDYSSAMEWAIYYAARDYNHIFVAAAGNDAANMDSANGVDFPASFNRWRDNVVSVAATNDQDKLAGFSNYGRSTVDIAAPGKDIVSTVPREMGFKGIKGYDSYSGTSMAAPFVTGALSLVRDLHPEWTYRQIIDQVLSSATEVDHLKRSVVEGRRLNVNAAVRQAAKVPPGVPPALTREAGKVSGASFAKPNITANRDQKVFVLGSPSSPAATTPVLTQTSADLAIPQIARYRVTIEGVVNGKSFKRKGVLVVKPTMNENTLNDVNPRDLLLKSGSPAGNPKVGAIQLATNNGLFKGFIHASQKMDLAKVDLQEKDSSVTARLIKDLTTSGLNSFNDSDDLFFAHLYTAYQGKLTVEFKQGGDRVEGEIQIKGAANYHPLLPVGNSITYKATISGKRVS